MVPVLDSSKVPLMPCSEKRARKLMERKAAKAYWKNGVFCIILQRDPSERNYQDVVIGIDPGSKRTGITVATGSKVICNQLFNTPYWVKKAIEQRKILRRARRSRKTPYRKCRSNRSIGNLPPSTKARWGAHLRVVDFWKKVVPLTTVSIEDIKASSKKNCKKWNKNFSPLEVGKKWFEEEVKKRKLDLYKFQGYETSSQRTYRGFKKTSKKLRDTWDAHNVDSHCLCELAMGDIIPFFGIQKCELFQWHRRQLHVVNPTKGGIRKQYGTTRSLGLNRGTLVSHPKYGLTYVGGTAKGRLSLHELETGKRLCLNAKKEDCKILTNLRWRTQLLPNLKEGEDMITQISWKEFRNSGALWFANRLLHVFGLVIVYSYEEGHEDDEPLQVFAAKTDFRGFSADAEDAGFKNLTTYMKDNIETLKKACFEE